MYSIVLVPRRKTDEDEHQRNGSTVRRFDSVKPLWKGRDRFGEYLAHPSTPVTALWQVLNVHAKEIVGPEHDESCSPRQLRHTSSKPENAPHEAK